MVDIKGRWALITGASRWIGYLCALFLAERGCNLILHGRTEEHLGHVLKKVRELGVSAYAAPCELSDPDAVENMLKTVDALNVPVDIVLNNAGVQVAYRTEYYSTPVSDYMDSFQINTASPMRIACHFIPKMKERGFGRVVNTTSGINHEPQQAGYSASKAALDKVTMDLANEVNGSDVIISLTDPGWCRTDLGGPMAPNAPESALPGVILGVFVDDLRSGRCFCAPDFHGMTLEEALEKAGRLPLYRGNIG